MISLSVTKRLKDKWPGTSVGVCTYFANPQPENNELWKVIHRECDEISKEISIEDIAHISHIHDTREAYKACGKKPSRYRVSSEALLRRIVQGKGLYHVNTIVDINNLVSIRSAYSLGTFNLAKIEPPVVFDIGNEGESYEGIGKGYINISNLPVFRDKIGPFGSPTSDSERAKVIRDAKYFLTVIISFSGEEDIPGTLTDMKLLLEQYAGAKDFEIKVI